MDKALSGYKIGFVGLGNMGSPMAGHLHDAGAEVVVWNRTAARSEAAVARGMRRASSLPELAREIGPGNFSRGRVGGGGYIMVSSFSGFSGSIVFGDFV